MNKRNCLEPPIIWMIYQRMGELKTVQKGSGFTPIIGVNIHLSDMINIAARYEHHTKIELENGY